MRSIISPGGIAAACLLALCAVVISGCAPKRSYAGDWNGSISIVLPLSDGRTTMHATFHVDKKDDGTYTSYLTLTNVGLQVEAFAVDGDKVTVKIKIPSGPDATFAGTSNAEGTEINGTFSQDGTDTPLKLTRASDAK
jgi:hypothetical protein